MARGLGLSATLRRLAVLAAVAALSVPSLARAKGAGGSAADRESARNLMDIGRQKAAAGKYEAALEAYRGADDLMHVPTTGLAVAQALRELGRLIEARERALQVTRLPEEDDEPKPFSRARKQAEALSMELAMLIPSLQVEVLSLESEAPLEDATVRLDGESLEASTLRLPRKLDPGKHTVAATAVGFDTTVKTLELGEGEHHVVTLVLRGPGSDGPTRVTDVSALVWIGYGFTVAGAIAGAATGAAALAKSAALETDCPAEQCPESKQGTIDSMNLFSHISTVSFAVAGVGAVLGTVGVVLSLGGEEEESLARVTPTLGPGFVGLQGQF